MSKTELEINSELSTACGEYLSDDIEVQIRSQIVTLSLHKKIPGVEKPYRFDVSIRYSPKVYSRHSFYSHGTNKPWLLQYWTNKRNRKGIRYSNLEKAVKRADEILHRLATQQEAIIVSNRKRRNRDSEISDQLQSKNLTLEKDKYRKMDNYAITRTYKTGEEYSFQKVKLIATTQPWELRNAKEAGEVDNIEVSNVKIRGKMSVATLQKLAAFVEELDIEVN